MPTAVDHITVLRLANLAQ